MSTIDLSGLQTEARNISTIDIDRRTTLEICLIINNEDSIVSGAVQSCLPVIAGAIDSLVERICRGGRIISVGAGTSGRLGVLDASELPPTFSANPEQFIALIAGGDHALRSAREGAEDDVEAAVKDLEDLELNGLLDSLIGIAASGRTPYVLSALKFASSLGCNTIGIACSYPSAMSTSGYINHMINAITGPEVITGSTRLKAGTATKMVLNMLNTATMIKTGRTYGNIMIDLKATNVKLQERARNILRISSEQAAKMYNGALDGLLKACSGGTKLALLKLKLDVSVEEAQRRLESSNGILSDIDLTVGPSNASDTMTEGQSEFVLCVDGGGSKCAAVICDRRGRTWRHNGYSACNVTSVGVKNVVREIKSTVEAAIAQCPQLKGRSTQSVKFARVWIALAGYDRGAVSELIDEALSLVFGVSVGGNLQVSTDVGLLANIAGTERKADTVVAVIAGTGSIAMTFKKQAEGFVRTARAGGWGPLLGDNGSGFDIGRQALRQALADIDQRNASRNDGLAGALGSLTQKVIQHFVPDAKADSVPDLLTTALLQESIQDRFEQASQRRIASLAPLIIEASLHDPQAMSIIEGAVGDLKRLIEPFMQEENPKGQSLVFVFAGGLMKSSIFRDRLHKSLPGIPLTSFVTIEDPAQAGAEYLSKLVGHSDL